MPNWAEQVTAIATAIGANGLVSAIGAAVFAGRQVEEARIGRQAEIATDFFRRWNDEDMVETRRLVATYGTPEALREAFVRHMTANDIEAYVMLRELDYFEQLGALDQLGALNFELVRLLLGQRLVDRWELWEPSVAAMGPEGSVYPNFAQLAAKMRTTLASTGA